MSVYRVNKSFFQETMPPRGYHGWSLRAFQHYCRLELEEAGFDLRRPLRAAYNNRTGDVVFWQTDDDLLSASLN